MTLLTPLLTTLLLTGCKDGADTGDTGAVGDDTSTPVDADADGYDASTDCDDADNTVNPGATEICDGIDNNCDGDIDEGVTTTYYSDADGDGFGDESKTEDLCELEDGYSEDSTDCDDTNADINPDATEVCNDADDDCDGEVDDSVGDIWYADADGDGFGDADNTEQDCNGNTGYVADDTDCDDANKAINPDADEVCDDIDNDCDGLVDDDDDTTPVDAGTWYFDYDDDGFGDADDSELACDQPDDHVEDATDCDDSDEDINPDATEVCNDVDDDCDSLIDDDDDTLDDTTGSEFFADTDGDGFGDAFSSDWSCDVQLGYVDDDTDCDDGAAAVNPDATEICNDIDDDCDGDIDDADSSLDSSTGSTWYADGDSDNYGDAGDSTDACDQPLGYVSDDTDCDDDDDAVNPSASEICNDIDDDCNSLVDDDDPTVDVSTGSEYFLDRDTDGYGDSSVTQWACGTPSGFTSDDTDCDDNAVAVNPGADEVCNDIDDDCDSLIDDDDDSLDLGTASDWYADSDNDSYGDSDDSVTTCDAPSGYIADSSDCNDDNADINPGANEICNDVDDDCDTLADDADPDVDLSTGSVWYADADGDNYGDASSSSDNCDLPNGYVADATDCDDTNDAVNPAADEICNEIDDDCDTLIDDDDTNLVASSGTQWFQDTDGDGHGDATDWEWTCDAPAGYVESDEDCDDSDSAINPDETEICNDIDDDCDELIDDDDDSVDAASTGTEYYADLDGDGYGDIDNAMDACEQPTGYLLDTTDCDDSTDTTYPGADEYCNDVDDDCNDVVDDDGYVLDGDTFYADTDGDSFGDADNTIAACEEPSGYVSIMLDCDDADATEPMVVDGTDGSPKGSGAIDSPLSAIQDGIDNATGCVVVYEGTYYEALDFGGTDLIVTGIDGAESTIVDATGLSAPAVTFANGESSAATLDGFTLTGGEGDLDATSEGYVINSLESGTYYYDSYCGGGVYAEAADPTLTNLIVHSNSLPAASTTVSGNDYWYVFSYGGGMCFVSSRATVSDVQVYGNDADEGGGIYVDEGSVIDLSEAWIIDNAATYGAGVEVDGGTITMGNVASMWNAASGYGGGVLVSEGNASMTNVTLAGDDAPSGGGLYLLGASTGTVLNSIIANAATGEGVLVDGSASYDGDYNNVFGNVGGEYSGITDPTLVDGNISLDPAFAAWSDDGDWNNEDLSLGATSPSIDAGDPSILDADGTASDQGAFGGTASDWHDGSPGEVVVGGGDTGDTAGDTAGGADSGADTAAP